MFREKIEIEIKKKKPILPKNTLIARQIEIMILSVNLMIQKLQFTCILNLEDFNFWLDLMRTYKELIEEEGDLPFNYDKGEKQTFS